MIDGSYAPKLGPAVELRCVISNGSQRCDKYPHTGVHGAALGRYPDASGHLSGQVTGYVFWGSAR